MSIFGGCPPSAKLLTRDEALGIAGQLCGAAGFGGRDWLSLVMGNELPLVVSVTPDARVPKTTVRGHTIQRHDATLLAAWL